MKISQNATGGTITYDRDDWLGGEDTTSTVITSKKEGIGVARNLGIDVLRSLGYISPGALPVEVTNDSIVTTYLRNAVLFEDSAYLISNGALLHQLTSLSTGTLTNNATWPHTMNNAAAWAAVVGDDICNYYDYNAGTALLASFYSINYTE